MGRKKKPVEVVVRVIHEYPRPERAQPVKTGQGYSCSRCGQGAYYDGRCGDGAILMCGCNAAEDNAYANDHR